MHYPPAPFGPAPARRGCRCRSKPIAFERIVLDDLIPMIDGTTARWRTGNTGPCGVVDGRRPDFANHAHAFGQVFLDRLFQARPYAASIAKTAYNGVFATPRRSTGKCICLDRRRHRRNRQCMTAPGRCMRRSTRRVSTTCSMNRRARRTNSRPGAGTSPILPPGFFQPVPPAPRSGGSTASTKSAGTRHRVRSPASHRFARGQGGGVQGVDDALFVDVHPLAGAETFTWEILFRPDSGGAPEPALFHLQEKDPKTGEDGHPDALGDPHRSMALVPR